VIREFALRAGELTALGDGVFFLSIEELLDVLSGDDSATAFISARRETYARYCALPPYPTIIRGGLDPFEWAADPGRRSDVFGSHAPVTISDSDTITGLAGAAGRVEGPVRRLDGAEEGDRANRARSWSLRRPTSAGHHSFHAPLPSSPVWERRCPTPPSSPAS